MSKRPPSQFIALQSNFRMAPIKRRSNDAIYSQHLDSMKSIANTLSQKLKLSVLEMAFLSSFLINFLIARIMHYASLQEEVYNYYNDKRNFINQFFVKKGWGWTTFVIVVFHAINILHNSRLTGKKVPVITRAVITYIIVTIWWALFTQWCFGLPIMDRIFVLTGGKCTNIQSSHLGKFKDQTIFSKIENSISNYETNLINSYTCRGVRGEWTGGHDPSGHVFLMIHSSIYMFFEIAPYWSSWHQLVANIRSLITQLKQSANPLNTITKLVTQNPHMVVIPLIGLWWFMLLMTNLYFHSIGEKLVGLLFGYAINTIIYYLPRWNSAA